MDVGKAAFLSSLMLAISVIAGMACIHIVQLKHQGRLFGSDEWRGARLLSNMAVATVTAFTSAFTAGTMLFLLSRWPVDVALWWWFVAWAVFGVVFAAVALPVGKAWYTRDLAYKPLKI